MNLRLRRGTIVAAIGGALALTAATASAHSQSGQWVETTQVAPTILRLLGLEPSAL
jgi:hypothetical protein